MMIACTVEEVWDRVERWKHLHTYTLGRKPVVHTLLKYRGLAAVG